MNAYQLSGEMRHSSPSEPQRILAAMIALNTMRNNNYCVAVDFDGTLCESNYPEIGQPNTEIIDRIKLLHEWGIKLILWTCREGDTLVAAMDWCKEQGIIFDTINDNLPSLKAKWENDPRKIGASEYWDDRAVCVTFSQSSAGGGKIPLIRKLEKDISVSELLHMRESDMTNHQIAQSIGVCEATIYRYIGRRSQAVKYAEIQNKPCPFAPREPVATIKQADGTSITSELETIVPTEVASPVSSFSMRIIKQSRVMDLQGSVCVFHIDTSNAIVEMREGDGGVVTGIIDVTSIPAFVRELQEIAQMVQGLEG